ncbi:Glyoxylase, beta-lactamase superfamily II [Nonlabens sp. Hel1_33_55]|uniref:MBL fold metallo-hydrolase n=1 Tax=Nonlabens sp. Hel1_33_55 TaxID=1336802 RepID=UPI000875AC66|nr:MBL fold metallo-hydrolase [Nonlabens sp. Hel1_33_55]SCY14200.1 Glyoxylase, beta-lactamase superfamily II [Nonlabens sp. Hel1_33_55]
MKNNYFLLILAGLLSMAATAQMDPATVTIMTTEVTDDVYMLEGRGGNIMIVVSEDKTLMVDSQFAPLSDKIKQTIDSISSNDITYLVNTHHHGDHTGGNENFNSEETTVVAQKNVLERLKSEDKATGYLPELTLDEQIKLKMPNDPNIMVVHVHNAHTDGDSFVYFVDKNVVHMGDVFFKDKYPYIDLNSGGSINGYIAAQQLILKTINEDTHIIPGHGKLATVQDLKNSINMLKDLRDAISLAMSRDQTKEEILANATITKRYDELNYGDGFVNSERIKQTIYNSLKNPNTDK